MPTTDEHDKRTYANQVKRHEDKLRALADHIAEYAGYLKAAAESDKPTVMGESYAATIAADVAEVRQRIAALDALRELSHVFE